MNKENMVPTGFGEHPARITRARAAQNSASGVMLPPKPSTNQDQKRALRCNSKRPPLGEINPTSSAATGLQNKRRAVLKDATNVRCESSYKSCISAAKVQTKNYKSSKRVPVKKDPKVVPAVGPENPEVQVDAGSNAVSETGKSDITESRGIIIGEKLDNNVSIQQNIESSKAKLTLEESSKAKIPLADSSKAKLNLAESSTAKLTSAHAKLGEQISRMHLQRLSPFEKDKDSLCEEDGSEIRITNIDSDHKNPLLCSLYAPDIYSNLRVAELMSRRNHTYMGTIQHDITQDMRGILIDWLVEVAEEYKLASDTLYLTVYFIDQFLSHKYIERQRLQLLGITCMLIASKYEEICAPRVEEFCFITDNTYTRAEVVKMESHVLNVLRFQLSVPTVKTFLRRYLRAAQSSFYKSPVFELELLASYLAELTLLDYGSLKFLPSLIAASVVFLARWTLDQSSSPWNPTLEHYTGYKALDLKPVVFALHDLQKNTKCCPLPAIREKYKHDKYKRVSTLLPLKPLETLF